MEEERIPSYAKVGKEKNLHLNLANSNVNNSSGRRHVRESVRVMEDTNSLLRDIVAQFEDDFLIEEDEEEMEEFEGILEVVHDLSAMEEDKIDAEIEASDGDYRPLRESMEALNDLAIVGNPQSVAQVMNNSLAYNADEMDDLDTPAISPASSFVTANDYIPRSPAATDSIISIASRLNLHRPRPASAHFPRPKPMTIDEVQNSNAVDMNIWHAHLGKLSALTLRQKEVEDTSQAVLKEELQQKQDDLSRTQAELEMALRLIKGLRRERDGLRQQLDAEQQLALLLQRIQK